MPMIGAPAWLLGNAQHPSFLPQLPQVQTGAPGFGITHARWADPAQGLSGLGITRARWMDAPSFSQQNAGQLEGVMDLFESPWWRYRKWIVLGGAGLLGLAALSLAGAVLR